MNRLRILLADDDSATLVRLRRLIGAAHDVVGAVQNGELLLSAAMDLKPDVLVVDIGMPIMNGIDAVRRYRRTNGPARVLFLSNHLEPAIVQAAFEAGADGFVPKTRAAEELIPAIENVAQGGTFMSPSLTATSESQ